MAWLRNISLLVFPAVLILLFVQSVRASENEAVDKALYYNNCAACHQPTGAGIPEAFPALAGNEFVTGDSVSLARVMLDGRAGMPSFKASMNDAELALVASYIRNSWGNCAETVSPETFSNLRQGDAGEQSVVPAH